MASFVNNDFLSIHLKCIIVNRMIIVNTVENNMGCSLVLLIEGFH